MKNIKRKITNLCLFLCSFFVLSLVVHAGEFPSFYFSPVELSEHGAKLVIEDVSPGDTVVDYLQLSLLNNVPSRYGINSSNLIYINFDELGVSKEEALALDVASWIEFPEGPELVLDSIQKHIIPVKINVPDGITPGDYAGVFMARLIDYSDDVKNKEKESDEVGSGTNITIAMGVEFFIRVLGDKIEPNLSFSDLSYSIGEDKSLNVLIDYENTGTALIVPVGILKITDVFGRLYYNEKFNFSLISPNMSDQSSIRLGLDDFNVGYGIYNVDVELKYFVFDFSTGKIEVERQKVYLAGNGRVKIYSLPWRFFQILGFIFLIVLFYFLYRNIRYFLLKKSSKKYLIKSGDTLQNISKKFKVDAKDIIRLNKLKAPYFLKEGTDISIPKK